MFPQFSQLTDELKILVLSFVADAPFEQTVAANGNASVRESSLTHTLPLVCQQFRSFCESDELWRAAIERQLKREPYLWEGGLNRIAAADDRQGTSGEDAKEAPESKQRQAPKDLISKSHAALGQSGYKNLYRQILNHHIRFSGPVFMMPAPLKIGEPYELHFFEPRYRLMISEVMADQPDEAKRGGRIRGNVTIVHAHRMPVAPTSPVMLVHVLRCFVYPDGRADVLLFPVAYAWIEKLWVRQNSGNLYYSQVMRMGKKESGEMISLAHRESAAQYGYEIDDVDDDDEDDY